MKNNNTIRNAMFILALLLVNISAAFAIEIVDSVVEGPDGTNTVALGDEVVIDFAATNAGGVQMLSVVYDGIPHYYACGGVTDTDCWHGWLDTVTSRPASGILTYEFVATGADGSTDREFKTIRVVEGENNNPEINSKVVEPTNPKVNEPFTITVNAIDIDTHGLSYIKVGNKITYCDQKRDCVANVVITEKIAGMKTYNIIVVDMRAGIDTSTISVNVQGEAQTPTDAVYPVIVDYVIEPTQLYVGEEFVLDLAATDNIGLASIEIEEIGKYACEGIGDTDCHHGWLKTALIPGTHTYTAKATDVAGNVITKELTVKILDKENTGAFVTFQADRTNLQVGEMVTLTAQVNDPDGIANVKVKYKNAWNIKYCDYAEECGFNPVFTESEPGVKTYVLTTTDKNGKYEERSLQITWTGEGDDQVAPIIVDFVVEGSNGENTVECGGEVVIDVAATDETKISSLNIFYDGSWKQYACPNDADPKDCHHGWLDTVTNAKAGDTLSYKVFAYDAAGNPSTEKTKTIKVTCDDNIEPMVTLYVDQNEVYEREPISIDIEAYSEAGLSYIEFVSHKGNIIKYCDGAKECFMSRTEFESILGPYETQPFLYKARAVDMNGHIDTDQETVRVNKFTVVIEDPNTNMDPEIENFNANPNPAKVGETIFLDLAAYDEDGSINLMQVFFQGKWHNYDVCSGHYCVNQWSLSESKAGTYTYIAQVTDNEGGKTQQTISVKVTDDPITKDNVKFVSDPITTVCAGDVYEYIPVAVSSQNNGVTYSFSTGPLGMSLNKGILTWPTIMGDAGRTESVIIGADDGDYAVTQRYTLEVLPQSHDLCKGIGQEDINAYLGINNVRLLSPEVTTQDDTVHLEVIMNNNMGKDLEDVVLILTIPELGVRNKEGPFFLHEDKTSNKDIFLELPTWTQPGVYDIKVDVGNEDVARIKYVQFTVI